MDKKKVIVFIIGIILLAILIYWRFLNYSFESLDLRTKTVSELKQFVIGSDLDIAGFYPKTSAEVFSESVNFEIFSALTKLDREGRLLPDLADYWFNSDDLTWDIYLKKGVKFHNGNEMTSEDVLFSLVELPRTLKGFYKSENLVMIENVQVVDPYKVRIKTKRSYPLLMYDLANLPILSSEYIRKEGYEADPVGTGPFKFLKREKGKEIQLERFEDYYDKKPIVKRVIYKIIPEEEKRIEALIKGEVDFITQVSLGEIEKLKQAKEVKIVSTPSAGITFLGLNLERSFLKNPLARKAIAKGIDRKKIIEEIFQNRVRVATQLSVPEAFGFNPEIKSSIFDPQEAKALLIQAGFPKGFEMELLASGIERERVAQMIAEQLSIIGIKVKPKIVTRGEFFSELMNTDSFLLTILDRTRDVTSLALSIYHTRSEEFGRLNLANYSNPRVDELIIKSMTFLLDPKTKQEYGQEIMRITAEEDLPYIPLYIGEFLGAVREGLVFSQRPDGLIVVSDLSLSN